MAGAVEEWYGQSWGCQLEWLPAEMSAWGLSLGQGWWSLSPLAWGDLPILQLLVEPQSCRWWLSLVCCAGRQRLRQQGKPAAVTPWHLSAADWLLQWCCQKAQQCLLEWGRDGVEWGVWMAVVTLSGCMPLRSTSFSCGLQVGLPGVVASQWGSSWKLSCEAPSCHSNLPDTPPCPSVVTVCIPAAGRANYRHPHWAHNLSRCWHGPHSIGVHGIVPHSAGQKHMSSQHFCPPAVQVCGLPPLELSSRPGMDMTILQQRLKTLSYPAMMFGMIRRNAISSQGFSASPHALTWERVFSCACVIAHMRKFVTTGQKSSDPHLSFIISSHKLVSMERSMKLLKVVCNGRKGISSVMLASGQQHPNTWGRCWQLHLGISPQPLDGVLMESGQMRTQAASNHSTLTSSYAAKIVWQMVKVSLMVLWCLENNWVCLFGYLCCSKSV